MSRISCSARTGVAVHLIVPATAIAIAAEMRASRAATSTGLMDGAEISISR